MQVPATPFKNHDRIIRGLILACAAGFVVGALTLIWS
jgi:hypothetical protein